MHEIQTLNTAFGQGDALHFAAAPNGLIQAIMRTGGSEARVLLQGAQVIHYQPAGQQPVLWISEKAIYQTGRSLRGGVPVCWPWFGARADGLPAHGFARNLDWQVASANAGPEGIELTLELLPSKATRTFWPYDFRLTLTVKLRDALRMTLNTEHLGSEPCEITQALHTYLHVGDIRQVAILGLGNTPFLDKTRNMLRDVQHEGALRLNGETDRIYLDTLAEVVVEDPVLQRRLHVRKEGSRSTVVWNPWDVKAGTLTDMRADEFSKMLCVETTNAGEDRIQLAPGAVHRMVTEISVSGIA